MPRHLHSGADPRAPPARFRRAARAVPAATVGDGLRPLPAWGPVPHRGARRLGRGRQPHARREGRRQLAAARREVVLLGCRCRSVRCHRAAGGRARGNARHRLLPRPAHGRRAPQRLHDPQAQGQARHACACDRRDRVRRCARVSDRRARGRLQDRRRRCAQHLALAECGRLGRGDAPCLPGGGGIRARARGVRQADRRVPARSREPRGDAGGGRGRPRLIARGDAARRLGGSGRRRVPPHPRQREQVLHLGGRRRAPSGAASRCWEGTARSRTSRCCRGCGGTRSCSRAGRGRTTSSAHRLRAT